MMFLDRDPMIDGVEGDGSSMGKWLTSLHSTKRYTHLSHSRLLGAAMQGRQTFRFRYPRL